MLHHTRTTRSSLTCPLLPLISPQSLPWNVGFPHPEVWPSFHFFTTAMVPLSSHYGTLHFNPVWHIWTGNLTFPLTRWVALHVSLQFSRLSYHAINSGSHINLAIGKTVYKGSTESLVQMKEWWSFSLPIIDNSYTTNGHLHMLVNGYICVKCI